MHIHWNMRFSELDQSFSSSCMTYINFYHFQPLFLKQSSQRIILRIRKARLREYRDESCSNLLLTGCQAAKSLLIDLLMRKAWRSDDKLSGDNESTDKILFEKMLCHIHQLKWKLMELTRLKYSLIFFYHEIINVCVNKSIIKII